jgi:hypothetical protein
MSQIHVESAGKEGMNEHRAFKQITQSNKIQETNF